MIERLGNRIAPPRYVLFLVLMLAGYAAYRHFVPGAPRPEALAMGFDGAAAAFLVSLVPLLRDSKPDEIRRHARDNDANRMLVLVITSVLTLVVMAAIAGELKPAASGDHAAGIKLVVTLVLIWLFANSVYALHYAHLFYHDKADGSDCGGMDFPGTATPDYVDFAYFAFTLGMTFQTSDVAITARPVRVVALLHSAAAFVFNIGVIAFIINTLGGG
jgi:uncharacterized membrane protein